MDRIVFDRMAEFDNSHWWYQGRRRILETVISDHLKLPPQAQILEVGCGTGHNLSMLSQHGRVDALEIDDTARDIASQRLGRPVGNSPLPELPGVERDHYEMIGLFDVLEHIEDDVGALKEIGQCLSHGGKLLLTVPAFPWMWTAHDEIHHHHRRYSKATLQKAIEQAGLKVEMLSWFNSILFPIAAISRIWNKISRKADSDDGQPGPLVNAVLRNLFAIERHLVGRLPMPPGVSLMVIASRA